MRYGSVVVSPCVYNFKPFSYRCKWLFIFLISISFEKYRNKWANFYLLITVFLYLCLRMMPHITQQRFKEKSRCKVPKRRAQKTSRKSLNSNRDFVTAICCGRSFCVSEAFYFLNNLLVRTLPLIDAHDRPKVLSKIVPRVSPLSTLRS